MHIRKEGAQTTLSLVHVAAAMAAGIDLVHGVKMPNTLRAKGAIE